MNQRLTDSDRGLAYGDGLFETVRVNAGGRAPLWPRHRARLLAGAGRLGIPLEAAAVERCLEDAVRGQQQAGVAKLILTRGQGGRGYLPPAQPSPTLIGRFGPAPQWPDSLRHEGLDIGLCDTPLGDDPLAGLKHLNRLPQVLARAEVERHGWHEGLLLNARRQPVEATAMNLFAVFGDVLWTPSLQRAGVAGVARAWLLQHAADYGLLPRIDMLPLSRLRQADGVFLANSVVGVLPVRKLAQWVWPVPAPVRQIQQDLQSL